jgi:hypothetical protein
MTSTPDLRRRRLRVSAKKTDDDLVGADGAGGPELAALAGDGLVVHQDGGVARLEGDVGFLADGPDRGVQVDAVVVEIDSRDLSAVPAVQLVGWPAGVNELVVKDAVVDDDLVEGGDADLLGGIDPVADELVAGDTDCLEHARVAKAGVTVAVDDEGLTADAHGGGELVILPQGGQSGGGGDQLHVAGGGHGVVGILGDDLAPRGDVAKGVIERGLPEIHPADDLVHFVFDGFRGVRRGRQHPAKDDDENGDTTNERLARWGVAVNHP